MAGSVVFSTQPLSTFTTGILRLNDSTCSTATLSFSKSTASLFMPVRVDRNRRLTGFKIRCETETENEEKSSNNDPKSSGIFGFVTNNPSSKEAIQLPNTPAQDGNLGQMITAIENKGRDFGYYVQAGKFRWFVRETGEANPNIVIFLHGAPTQSYSFRNVMSQLAQKGFHCYAPDWIGFGFSEKPQPGYGFNYTEEEYHNELNVLLEKLNIDQPFHLVVQGYITGSFGLTWALQNKEKFALKSVSILNSPLTDSSRLPSVFQQLRLPFVGEFVCQNAILAERFVEGGSPYVLDIDDADVYRLPYLNSSAPGFSLLEVSRKVDVKGMLNRITTGFSEQNNWSIPTLVVWGIKDKYMNQTEANDFASKNSKFITPVLIEGAGHLPQEDWPEKVVDALCSAFQQ